MGLRISQYTLALATLGSRALAFGALTSGVAGCGELLDLDYSFSPAPECAEQSAAPGFTANVEQTTCQLAAADCEAGQSRCSLGNPSNAVQACGADGAWSSSTTPCGEAFCVDGACRACRPGSARCGSVGLERCAIDGEWLSAGVCGIERPVCVDGTCVVCSPGAVQCNGDTTETCAADGSAWVTTERCSGETPACLEATHSCGRCGEGDRQCSATAVQICDPESRWLDETPCSGDLPVCDAGTLTCVCQEGTSRCEGTTAMSRCQSGAFVQTSCGTGSRCDIDRCKAQDWTLQFGSDGADILRSVSVDAADNILVTGSAAAALPDQPSTGNGDAFVRKYDPAGTELWTEQFGSTGPVHGHAVATDTNANVVVSGTSTRRTLLEETTIIQTDAFIHGYDAQSAEVWTFPFGTTAEEGSAYLALDTESNIYVGGDTTGEFPGETARGGSDLYIQKYAPNRELLWTLQPGSEGNETALEIAVDRNGNVVIVGSTDGALTPDPNAGGLDAFVIKYDRDRRLRWAHQFGTTGDDVALGVTFDADGDVLVVGYVNGGLPGRERRGGQDAFARKYAIDGAESWTLQFGGAESDDASVVRADGAGSVFVGGRTVVAEDGRGDYDVFVLKLDAGGIEGRSRRFGSSRNESLNGLAIDSQGNVVAGGHTDGVFEGLVGIGGNDAWLVKLVE